MWECDSDAHAGIHRDGAVATDDHGIQIKLGDRGAGVEQGTHPQDDCPQRRLIQTRLAAESPEPGHEGSQRHPRSRLGR